MRIRMDDLKYPFYLITHPFDGFWDLKYDKRGKLSIAIGILLLFTMTVIFKLQSAGFLVNFARQSELNSIDELTYVVMPFLLWCIANWSLTTLMDGEGKFVEIIIATAYAMVPMILIYIPTTIISNFITLREATFYVFFDAFATFWFMALVFIGTMTIHQYSVTKTVITIGLTIVVMCIVVFLGLLFFSLLQQMITFVLTIYQELVLRL